VNCEGYGKSPVVADLLGMMVDVVDPVALFACVVVGPVGIVEDVVALNTSGVDVKGGGNGAPFVSPLILRFSGGSRGAFLSFFLPLMSPFGKRP
jgi:hypothetical protein